jgi:hypothetical protein
VYLSVTSRDISLAYSPREWQRAVHTRPKSKRFTVLALHRRAGKTELALMELIDAALRFTLPQGMFVYLAPFLKQAKVIAWSRLKFICEPLRQAGQVEIREGENAVVFHHNGAVIRIFGGDNPDALRGTRIDGAVIDEVAQIKPEVWEEVLQPAMSDRHGWGMFIGTPHGVNLFSELYYGAADRDDWHAALWDVYSTEALDPGEITRLRRDMTEQAFAREYLCDFTASGDDQVISLAVAIEAAQREYQEADINYHPKVIGVDPARFGDDRSCIIMRQGLQAYEPITFNGIDNMALASRVVVEIERHEPEAVFVDAGNGSGVIDRLRQLGHQVIEVNFGGKPMDGRFLNKRAEMWWAVKDWLEAGGAIPNDRNLLQDLASPLYWYDSQQRIQLEPKSDIKKRGLSSPDAADALACTFAFPVVPKHKQQQKQFTTGTGYDPFS